MITHASDRSETLAEALRQLGIASDAPEADLNPFWAAQQAFYVCEGRTNADDWREWKQSLTGSSVPRAAYYRGSMVVCRRALRHQGMPDDLREAVTHAWGYFAGLLNAEGGLDSVAESSRGG